MSMRYMVSGFGLHKRVRVAYSRQFEMQAPDKHVRSKKLFIKAR